MTDSMLFDGFPDPQRKTPVTPGEALRARQQAAIDNGHHPLTKLPLLVPPGRTCGDCAHRIRVRHNDGRYPKCDQTSMSRSEVSDCRAWWPACIAFTPKPDSMINKETR